MKTFPLRSDSVLPDQWMSLPAMRPEATDDDFASVIAQCNKIRERMLDRMSRRLPDQTHRTKKRVIRQYFLSAPARVATLYLALSRRRVDIGPEQYWSHQRVLERGARLDVFHPTPGPIRVGEIFRQNGDPRTVFCQSHIDYACHRLAHDAVKAVMQFHPGLFLYSGGERALRDWLGKNLPQTQLVLTTDFPKFFWSLRREHLTSVTPLPRRVTKALLEEPIILPAASKDADPQEGKSGIFPSALTRRISCWSFFADWLSAQPTCAQELRDGWGILQGSPLSQIASQAVLHPILTQVENAAEGVKVGCYADNLIVLLSDASTTAAVESALAQAVRDAIRGDCQSELLGRISADLPRRGFNFIGYRIALGRHGVKFSPSRGDWDGVDNRFLSDLDVVDHDEDTVVNRCLSRMRPLVNDASCLQLPLRTAYRAGALIGDPPLLPVAPPFEPEVEIYTDGSAVPGRGAGGWSAVINDAAGTTRLHGGSPLTSNNEMELLAVVLALESLAESKRVHVMTDSRYVADGARDLPKTSQTWRTTAGKPRAHTRLWKRLGKQLNRHEVAVHWVRGHAKCAGNIEADALAKKALADMKKKRHRWDMIT